MQFCTSCDATDDNSFDHEISGKEMTSSNRIKGDAIYYYAKAGHDPARSLVTPSPPFYAGLVAAVVVVSKRVSSSNLFLPHSAPCVLRAGARSKMISGAARNKLGCRKCKACTQLHPDGDATKIWRWCSRAQQMMKILDQV